MSSLCGANVVLSELCRELLAQANWQPASAQEATIYLNLGSVYYRLGQKQEALDYYQQALAVR
jgi:Tfp pilus assembly protein PilF